jgi:prenylcysteine oxidase/farnesylcysteine lyase
VASGALASRQIWNSLILLWRYGYSLLMLDSYVSELLEKWDQFYNEGRPVYDTVEEMLKSIDLYNLTQHPLELDLLKSGFSLRFIDELVTLIVRINYGQNKSISGLAGAVALAGSGDDLWKVKEGNWRGTDQVLKFFSSSQ